MNLICQQHVELALTCEKLKSENYWAREIEGNNKNVCISKKYVGNKVIKLHFQSLYEREEKFECDESNENCAFVIASVCVNNEQYFFMQNNRDYITDWVGWLDA